MKKTTVLRLLSSLGIAALVAVLSACGTPNYRPAGPGSRDADTQAMLDKVYLAHGGLENWQRLERIDARLITGGLAFSMRNAPINMEGKQIAVFPHQFKTVIYDYPTAGSTGIWEGDSVTIQPAGGGQPLHRDHARDHFFVNGGTGHDWDDLDQLYFVGYAIWNYLNFPFLLQEENIAIRLSTTGGHPMLDVQFPQGFPTHSRQQYFLLDDNGMLRRHDYVAEVFASWASAANICITSDQADGFVFYTNRKVKPVVGRNFSLPFPTILRIKVEDIKLNFK
jgi:hypothetical protein